MIRSLLLASFILCPAVAAAQTELSRSVSDVAGATISSDSGGVMLSFSLGQTASDGPLAASGVAVSGGFFGVTGSGLPPASLTVVAVGASALANNEGAIMGVTCLSSMTITFDKAMIAERLRNATSVTLVRDSSGRFLNSNEDFALNYDGEQTAAQIVSSTGCWPSNSVFKVSVSSYALDTEGFALTPGVTFYFVTLADPTRDNVLSSLGDPQTQLRIASGTFRTSFFVRFNTQPQLNGLAAAGAIDEANRKSKTPVVQTREMAAFDAAGQTLAAAFQAGQGVLTQGYADSNGDGFVDGFGYRTRVKKLSLYYLDEYRSLWVRAPGSRVDTVARSVTAPIPHLSSFALIATEDLSVSDAYAFPVPFAPNGPNAGTGGRRSGTESGGITFTMLPTLCSIEVFNVRGERVWRGEETDGDGRLVWNVRNTNGEKVASGIYLYVIKSAADQKVGKLAVVR